MFVDFRLRVGVLAQAARLHYNEVAAMYELAS